MNNESNITSSILVQIQKKVEVPKRPLSTDEKIEIALQKWGSLRGKAND
jgi:hypothetical protein